MPRRGSRSAKIAVLVAAVGSLATWVGACNALLDTGSFTFGSCDTVGDLRCTNNALQQCSPNGTWTASAPPCQESACSADAGGCVGVCAPQSVRCNPDGEPELRDVRRHRPLGGVEQVPARVRQRRVQGLRVRFVVVQLVVQAHRRRAAGNTQLYCDSTGMWMAGEACSAPTPACLKGMCVPCLPGSTQCQGSLQQTCGPTGHWQDPSACPAGTSCQPDQGKCGEPCKSGEWQCYGDSGIIQRCSDAGQWDDVDACADPCVPCSNGACVQADAGTPCTPPCFTAGVCGATGACVGTDPVECVDASDSLCNAPTCDPATGRCSVADGMQCDGHDSCSLGDTCNGGVCSGTPAPDPSWAHWSFTGSAPSPPYEGTSQVVYDRLTQLMWQLTPYDSVLSNDNAQSYCECLNDPPPAGVACSTNAFTVTEADRVAGYPSGWRLPTRIELMSIVDYDAAAKGKPPLLDPSFQLSKAGDTFWTVSILYESSNSRAFTVSFADGTVSSNGVFNKAAVRCVRGAGDGAAAPSDCGSRFSTAGVPAHEVKDVETGLIWLLGTSFNAETFANAQTACSKAPEKGFHMPSVLELRDDDRRLQRAERAAARRQAAGELLDGHDRQHRGRQVHRVDERFGGHLQSGQAQHLPLREVAHQR